MDNVMNFTLRTPGPNALDSFLGNIGLGQPYMRFVAGAAVAAVLLWVMQPASVFYAGEPRPFVLLEGSDPNATVLPWYLIAVLAGLVLALFI